MKKRRRHISTTLCAALMMLCATFTPLQARQWETVKNERMTESRAIAHEGDVEVRSARGCIIVSTTRPTNIKVYTILGQLVSQETLPAGVSQLRINAHGVYIIKVGTITCKVAL